LDFWRRWHISLSTFLRDYLYIPLGGNRVTLTRAAINLVIVMFIGGLWHGAAWTFVVWGLLHGVYLAIEHVLKSVFGKNPAVPGLPGSRFVFWLVTYAAVCFAWVFFRAPDFTEAARRQGGLRPLPGDRRTQETRGCRHSPGGALGPPPGGNPRPRHLFRGLS